MNSKSRILIVDDDSDLRETLSRFLSEEGFTPLGFATGKAALKWMNGEPLWVELTSTPIFHNGEFQYALTTWVIPVVIITFRFTSSLLL